MTPITIELTDEYLDLIWVLYQRYPVMFPELDASQINTFDKFIRYLNAEIKDQREGYQKQMTI